MALCFVGVVVVVVVVVFSILISRTLKLCTCRASLTTGPAVVSERVRGAHVALTHTRTHARTHARTHTQIHTHTHTLAHTIEIHDDIHGTDVGHTLQ